MINEFGATSKIMRNIYQLRLRALLFLTFAVLFSGVAYSQDIDSDDIETVSVSESRISAQVTPHELIVAAPRVSVDEAESTEIEDIANKTEKVVYVPLKTDFATPSSVIRPGVNPYRTRPLTLSNAIRLALLNNNTIEIARDDVLIAESGLNSLQGSYDPSLTLMPSYVNSAQPQTSTLGGADLSGVTRSSSIGIDTNLVWAVEPGGGRFTSSFSNSRNESSNSFAQLNPTYSANLSFGYTQPLWRNRSVDSTRRQIKVQKKLIAQSDEDFRRSTIDVISLVQSAYWDLVFALRDQQNREANLNLSKENLRQVDARIKAGAAAPLERSEVLTELSTRETELLVATQSVATAENSLKQLILRDIGAPEWNDSFIPTDQPSFSDTPINLTAATAQAIENRPELKRLRLQREIYEIDIDYFKNQTRPQIDINFNYTMIGLAGTTTTADTTFTEPLISGNPATNANAFLLSELMILNPAIVVPDITVTTTSGVPTQFVGGEGRALHNMFTNDARTYSIGATINFPIRNRTAKANLATTELRQSQNDAQTRMQEQTVIAEVRNAVYAVQTARLRVVATRTARANAEIQLEGERKLYASGRSTTFLLFQRENALANARNAEVLAETDYNKAIASLQKATATTMSANNIVVESPADGN